MRFRSKVTQSIPIFRMFASAASPASWAERGHTRHFIASVRPHNSSGRLAACGSTSQTAF
jgi:hypothetical protein